MAVRSPSTSVPIRGRVGLYTDGEPVPYADPEKQRQAVRESMRRRREELYGPIQAHTCGWCGQTFMPKRYKTRAQYCCASCKASASQARRRAAAKAAAATPES